VNWGLNEMLAREHQRELWREAERDRLAALSRTHGAPSLGRARRLVVRAGRLHLALSLRWVHQA
jgi:hypothetical protein